MANCWASFEEFRRCRVALGYHSSMTWLLVKPCERFRGLARSPDQCRGNDKKAHEIAGLWNQRNDTEINLGRSFFCLVTISIVPSGFRLTELGGVKCFSVSLPFISGLTQNLVRDTGNWNWRAVRSATGCAAVHCHCRFLCSNSIYDALVTIDLL